MSKDTELEKAATAAFVKRFGKDALDFRREHGASYPPKPTEIAFCDGFDAGWKAARNEYSGSTLP